MGAFREHVADISSKKTFSEVSANGFRFVFSMIAKNVDLDFYRPCRGFRRFFKKACRSIDISGMREKTSKNLRRKPPKPSPEPSGTLQNRTQSASEREKIELDGQDCLDCLDQWLDKGLWSKTNGWNGRFLGGGVAPARQQPSEPGPRGGVGEGFLTSVKRLSCLEAHSTRRLAATLPRRILLPF